MSGCEIGVFGVLQNRRLDLLQSICLFRDRHRDVRAVGVNFHCLASGGENQVHVFHGDCAEQNFVAEDEGTGEATAITEGDLDRTDIWA
jgi:hypothetical protein